jgi:hypothetical protein
VCEEFDIGSFVPASAHEALARAERNLAYGVAIDLDDDDRGVIEGDLATLPLTD